MGGVLGVEREKAWEGKGVEGTPMYILKFSLV